MVDSGAGYHSGTLEKCCRRSSEGALNLTATMESRADGPAFRISLLGQPLFEANGARHKFAGLPRSLSLIAYLLLHRRSAITRESLAFTLWPDDAEDAALGKLRRHLHDAQRALPERTDANPWLIVERDSVQWNEVAGALLDIAEFERLGSDVRTRAAAVDVYRGDLLESLYDEWVFPERERFRSLYLRYLVELAQAHGSVREYDAAIGYAERLLTCEPWREDVLRELLRYRYESGDRSGALHTYELFATRLREEMSVDVMPETRAVRDAIFGNARLSPGVTAREEGRPSAAQPTTLPFIGRRAQLEALRAAWQRAARGNGACVFLSGEAGIGKSRLAREITDLARMQGGRVLIGSATNPERAPYFPIVDALDASAALTDGSTLAVESGERARLFEAFAARVREIARPRPVLLVLEDLHWAGEGTVAALGYLIRRLIRTPVCIVVTSRDEESPGDRGLRALRRELLAEGLASQIALPRLDEDAIVAALGATDTIARARAHVLYMQTAGHPLYLAELLRCSDESEHGSSADFSALIEARYASIDPSGKALAEIAAVAGDSFDADLVADVTGWGMERVLDATQQLIRRHLIEEACGSAEIGYSFTHGLIRSMLYDAIPAARRAQRHARIGQTFEERGDASDRAALIAYHFDRGGIASRASSWYLRAARQSRDLFANEGARDYLIRGLELNDESAERIAMLLLRCDIYETLGDRTALASDLDALAALAHTDDVRFELGLRRAGLARARSEFDLAAAAIAELERIPLAPDSILLARLELERGWNARATADFPAAHAAFARANELFEARSDSSGQVSALCGIVETLTGSGEIRAVGDTLARAQEIASGSDDARVVSIALRTAIAALLWQQDFDAARELAERALALARKTGDRNAEANVSERLAAIFTRLKNFRDAEAAYDVALELYRALDSPHGIAVVSLNRSLLLTQLSRFEEAARMLAEARVLFASLGDKRGTLMSILNLGMTAYYLERYDEAHAAATQALALARELKNRALEGIALNNLGAVEREFGNFPYAIACMEAGMSLDADRPVDAITDWSDLALAHHYAGDAPSAERCTHEALERLAAAPHPPPFPESILWNAAIVLRECDPEKSRAVLQDAAELLERASGELTPTIRVAYRNLRFNREIVAALHEDRWPVAPPAGRLPDASELDLVNGGVRRQR